MTQKIGRAATDKVMARLMSEGGLGVSIAELSPKAAETFDISHVHAINAAAELIEKTAGVQYPVVNVYCEKMSNDLVEKFRRFSGNVQMAIEVRLTQDRMAGISGAVELYVDAVVDVLTRNRGDWGDGMYFCGKYEVQFGTVKHGGKNFIEASKVVFDIGVSKD
jgi:hypothetical protein